MANKPSLNITVWKNLVLEYLKKSDKRYINQKDIADHFGVHPNTISKIIAVLDSENKIKIFQLGSSHIIVPRENEENG